MLLEGLSENPEEDLGRLGALRLDVVGQAAVVHQVAQAATVGKNTKFVIFLFI
jgi:hypothetical protein